MEGSVGRVRGEYLGEGVIRLDSRTSTRMRLHELAHKRMGHEPGTMSLEDFVDREIEAEKWAWETMDKIPRSRVGLPAALSLIDEYGLSSPEALDLVVRRLKANGIAVSRSDRQDLSRFL